MSDNKAVDGAIVDSPAPAGDDAPPLLGLPPPRAPAAGAGGRAGQSLDLSSGEARVELAHLGPMLLNDDGRYAAEFQRLCSPVRPRERACAGECTRAHQQPPPPSPTNAHVRTPRAHTHALVRTHTRARAHVCTRAPACMGVYARARSVSRIANWQQMTAKEQEVAARRVAERNERRRARLLAVEEREKLARQVDEAAQLGLESIQRFAGDLD